MATELTKKRCVACEAGMPTTPAGEIPGLLAQLPGWRVDDGKKLFKTFKRKDWLDAIRFVDRIGDVAEAEGHHPNLYVAWGRVDVTIWTHAVDALTENDFILAAKIDRAA
jgi:4a-hydroxytetrahydrobiopterin dehydratase